MDEKTAERQRLIAVFGDKQDDESFEQAKRAVEEALAVDETAELLLEYGYLHQGRGGSIVRQAIAIYERAMEHDPSGDTRAYGQWIVANAMLLQQSEAIDRSKERLAAAPENIVEYRYLTQAYLLAGEYEEAAEVIAAGLALDPADIALLEARGSVLSGRGRPEEALEAWLHAFELDPERSISARYSRVFLLQRLGRLEEAATEWEAIIAWLLERDYPVQAEWPKRELAELRARIGAGG